MGMRTRLHLTFQYGKYYVFRLGKQGMLCCWLSGVSDLRAGWRARRRSPVRRGRSRHPCGRDVRAGRGHDESRWIGSDSPSARVDGSAHPVTVRGVGVRTVVVHAESLVLPDEPSTKHTNRPPPTPPPNAPLTPHHDGPRVRVLRHTALGNPPDPRPAVRPWASGTGPAPSCPRGWWGPCSSAGCASVRRLSCRFTTLGCDSRPPRGRKPHPKVGNQR